MFVSLFSCRVLYTAITGQTLANNKPFAEAAHEARNQLNNPRRFARMVAKAESIKSDRTLSFEQAVAAVAATI